jgi:hypothetical protein
MVNQGSGRKEVARVTIGKTRKRGDRDKKKEKCMMAMKMRG